MKKVLIFLMALSLFTACDNNKIVPDKKADYRKDDYDDKNADDNDKKNKKDDADDTGGGDWSRADKKAFDAKCLETLDNDEAKANVFCPCFFEKISKKYSSMQEVDEKSSEAEGKRLATICMDETGLSKKKNDFNNDDDNTSGSWTRSDENKFIDACSGTASKNVGEERANQYCKCMLDKMKKQYSSYEEADRALSHITREELTRLAADCNQ